MAIVKTCYEATCFHPYPCPIHKRQDFDYDHARGSAHKRGYGRKWTNYRAWFLRQTQCPRCGRNHVLCEGQCKQNGQAVPAFAIDHITPHRGDMVLFWDHANHQSLCEREHNAKSRTEREDLEDSIERGAPRVVVVCGPPASGKTTYVSAHKRYGDLIVDLDMLYAALSGLPLYDKPEGLLPFVASARDAVYDRLHRAANVDTAWIITTNPSAANELRDRFHAQVITLTVDPDEQRKRLSLRSLGEFHPKASTR